MALSDQEIYQLADYLTNAIDRDSSQEMIRFVTETFHLDESAAGKIVTRFLVAFGTRPVVLEDEALSLIRSIAVI